MARFKLTIEYAGTRYSGWQIQKNARTVQGEISRAVVEVTRESTFELYGSGRTDAGVHALAQVAHLDVRVTMPAETLRRRLNDKLPADINILSVTPVRHRFHARHDAVARSYLYQIARRRTAFAKAYVWWVKEELDFDAMRSAASLFVGRHDFESFTDADPEEASTLVQLDRLEMKEEGELVLVRIEGSHFIWKMVRRIVGVLVEVGKGGLTPDDVRGFLQDRSPVPARVTAPPSGLFLERVYYEKETRPAGPLAAMVRVPPAGP
jgi:tRNA pseudouridine38-40 synthase